MYDAKFDGMEECRIIIGRMYRSRKLEESSLFNRTASNASMLSETSGQLFEREIDNYTRMLEQDKRRFFRLQENGSEVLRDHAQKAKELDALKSRAFKTETMKRQGELKILERELNQTINSYNDVLALNKSFKAEIEELRKEKLNQKEALRRLTLRIEELNALVAGKHGEIQ
jgi:ABC-type hemin transport system substrate-binding protein